MGQRNSTALKKSTFLSAFRASLGVIQAACDKAEISRTTYYSWLAKDPKFAAAVAETNEATMDFVEHKMFEAIRKGDRHVIMWYLDRKGRTRGYGQKPGDTPSTPSYGMEGQTTESLFVLLHGRKPTPEEAFALGHDPLPQPTGNA